MRAVSHVQEAMTVAMLGMLGLTGMRPNQELRYVRGPRRWLGLRGGRLVEVEQRPQQRWQQLPQGEEALGVCRLHARHEQGSTAVHDNGCRFCLGQSCQSCRRSGHPSGINILLSAKPICRLIRLMTCHRCRCCCCAEVWSQAADLAPPEVWAALGGFLLSSALHALARWYQVRGSEHMLSVSGSHVHACSAPALIHEILTHVAVPVQISECAGTATAHELSMMCFVRRRMQGARQQWQQQQARAAAAQDSARRRMAQQRGRFERVLAGAEFEPAAESGSSAVSNGAGPGAFEGVDPASVEEDGLPDGSGVPERCA